jgi:nucleoside-triphosphatase
VKKQVKVFILSGGKGSGKTTKCIEIAHQLKATGYRIGGFLAPGTFEEGSRNKIQLQNLQTNEVIEFAQREARENWQLIQSFYFNPKAILVGEEWLKTHQQNSDFLFIDEIGRFDVNGKIWGPVLLELLYSATPLILTIRDIFVEEVIRHFKIKQYELVSSLEDLL